MTKEVSGLYTNLCQLPFCVEIFLRRNRNLIVLTHEIDFVQYAKLLFM